MQVLRVIHDYQNVEDVYDEQCVLCEQLFFTLRDYIYTNFLVLAGGEPNAHGKWSCFRADAVLPATSAYARSSRRVSPTCISVITVRIWYDETLCM